MYGLQAPQGMVRQGLPHPLLWFSFYEIPIGLSHLAVLNRSIYVVGYRRRMSTCLLFRNLFALLARQLKSIRVVLQLQHNN